MEQMELQLSYEYTIQLHQLLNVAISVIQAHNGMGQAVNQNQALDEDDEVVVDDEVEEEVPFRLVQMQNLYVKMEFFTSNQEIFVLDETLQKRVVLKKKFGEKNS
jgi:DNA repair protein RadC